MAAGHHYGGYWVIHPIHKKSMTTAPACVPQPKIREQALLLRNGTRQLGSAIPDIADPRPARTAQKKPRQRRAPGLRRCT